MPQIVQNIIFRGNTRQQPRAVGPALFATDLDFANREEFIFDFTLLQQGEQFSPPQTLYLDNSVNPKQAEINIQQTGQYIVCPPFSVGYFPLLNVQQDATVSISSDGGVTNGEKCYAAFYSLQVPPAVWSGFAPLVDGARVTLIGVNGLTNMSATNPLIVGGNASGSPVPLRVDANGRLEVIGSSAGGVAFGPDAPGAAPTQAPLQMSGIDNGGLVRRLLTTVAGFLRVDIASSVTGASAIQVQGAGVAGSAAVGNPVRAGGVYSATLPTLVDGQAGNLQLNSRGAALFSPVDNNGTSIEMRVPTDNFSPGSCFGVISFNEMWDGTNWDRARSMVAPSLDLRAGLGVQAFGGFGQFLTTPYTLTNGQYGELQLTTAGALKVNVENTVPVSGSVTANPTLANTATVTTVTLSGSSATVLSSSALRKSWSIYNNGSATVYVRFGASAASATDFSVVLVPGAYYENSTYNGEVRAFGASGTLRITSNA